MSDNREAAPRRPWGVMTGVIIGAITTLACVVRGLEPLMILERVCIASVVAGIVGSLATRTMRAIVAAPQGSSDLRGSYESRGQSRS